MDAGTAEVNQRAASATARMRRLLGASALLFLLTIPSFGHVGSPDVFYEGAAGAYRLYVTVRTPQMIPGVAEVEARVLEGDVSELRIVPLRLVGPGAEFAPPPDPMLRSKTDPQYFTGQLWLMASGSWQVRMEVLGAKGKAELAVPVPAAARRTMRMQKRMGALLLGLMLLLVASMIGIFGAAAREGKLARGEQPEAGAQVHGGNCRGGRGGALPGKYVVERRGQRPREPDDLQSATADRLAWARWPARVEDGTIVVARNPQGYVCCESHSRPWPPDAPVPGAHSGIGRFLPFASGTHRGEYVCAGPSEHFCGTLSVVCRRGAGVGISGHDGDGNGFTADRGQTTDGR